MTGLLKDCLLGSMRHMAKKRAKKGSFFYVNFVLTDPDITYVVPEIGPTASETGFLPLFLAVQITRSMISELVHCFRHTHGYMCVYIYIYCLVTSVKQSHQKGGQKPFIILKD